MTEDDKNQKLVAELHEAYKADVRAKAARAHAQVFIDNFQRWIDTAWNSTSGDK